MLVNDEVKCRRWRKGEELGREGIDNGEREEDRKEVNQEKENRGMYCPRRFEKHGPALLRYDN